MNKGSEAVTHDGSAAESASDKTASLGPLVKCPHGFDLCMECGPIYADVATSETDGSDHP